MLCECERVRVCEMMTMGRKCPRKHDCIQKKCVRLSLCLL